MLLGAEAFGGDGSEGGALHGEISVLVRRDVRDMSIREYGEEGPRPRHLVCQRLELGPRSLQNREIRPAPPGSPVQGRSSQSWKVLLHSRPPSTVLPRGRGPSGGPCWAAARRMAVAGVPMDPADQHAAPTRAQGPNGVSALDRSRDGARLSLRDPHPDWPLAAWSLPCPPPPRGGDGRPWWQGWCLSSVASEADT